MKFKSNVKPNKFYAEAEQMQKGWGRYLKKIDELKDAAQQNQPMSIKDYCWTLYGDGHTSHCWERFHDYYTEQFGKKRLKYQTFQYLFKGWVADIYDQLNKPTR